MNARLSLLNNLFETHLNGQNQIEMLYAKQSLIIVFIFIVIFLILSLRHKNIASTESQLMTHETGEMLRGIAIIFLIFGHLAIHCIEGTMFFEYAGVWAVIVFLFISGVALSKNYGEKRLGVGFFIKRATRILPAYWVALTLFFVLDYLLLKQDFSFNLLAWNYLCFRPTGLPIGVSWFITFILIQYIIFWISINLGKYNYIKLIILSALSIFISLTIDHLSFLISIYGMWIIYTMVFPYSCMIGIYHRQVYSILRSFYSWSRVIYISLMLFLLIFYVINFQYSTYLLYNTILPIKLITYLSFPLLIVVGLAMLTYLLDNLSFKSGLLIFLGFYSYEIFLIHQPFMTDFDFFLFREPLYASFFIYALLVLSLSMGLKMLTNRVRI